MINRIDGFIEEKNGDKYLNIASTDRNSEVLKCIQKFGMELRIVLKKQTIVSWKNMTKIKLRLNSAQMMIFL